MIIAIDYGEKRIGIAVSDESEKHAKSLSFIPCKLRELEKIYKNQIKKKNVLEVKSLKKSYSQEIKTEFRKVFGKILYLLNYYYCDKVIFGIPLTYDEKTNSLKPGKQARKVKAFAKKFESFLKGNNILCEIIFVEEGLSSIIAENNLRKNGKKNKGVKENIDSESAKVLIERYLNSANAK